MSEGEIDDLIGKVLASEATAAERERLSQWIEQSESNTKYFDQLKLVFEKSSAAKVKLKFDEDMAWRKVKSKIQRDRKEIFFSPAVLRMAAGIAIVAMIGYYFYQSKPTPASLAIRTQRQTRQDTLPDGSLTFVNKDSRLNYEFNSRENSRKVKLEGEAYFDVKHDETKPFVIEANEVLIQDIGTAFNVKAYPKSDTIVVTVEHGEVHFFTLTQSGIFLKEGETGSYIKSKKEFWKTIADNLNAIAYKTKAFNFSDTNLGSAVGMINEIYDSKIILGNTAIGNCRLTVNFNNNSAEEIAEIIAETLGLTLEKRDGNFILNGNGCIK